jgi:hypothetical protein
MFVATDVRSGPTVPTSPSSGADRALRHKERAMKYIILSYGSQKDYDALSGQSTDRPALTPEDFAPMAEFMESFTSSLHDSGELVEARGVAAPALTRRVRLKEGVPVVTDGPYAETQEVLAGYWVVECESFDRAIEIAARLAACPSPDGIFADAVADVRPLDEGPPPLVEAAETWLRTDRSTHTDPSRGDVQGDQED